MHVQEWLETVPAVSVYLLVGLVIGLESLGIPLPGEIVLVSAALLASQHGDINPVVLGACATAGAVIGDSIGYAIGRKGGRPLLAWLGGKFPKHFGAGHVAMAERSFEKWGMWAVFFGRFVALLRIFAGPLAGVLQHAVLEVPHRQRPRRHRLGRRHDRGHLLRGRRRRVVAEALLLARPGRRRADRPRLDAAHEAPGEEGGRRARGGPDPGRRDGRLTVPDLPRHLRTARNGPATVALQRKLFRRKSGARPAQLP